MIRREARSPSDAPEWILISQVEHARLSGILAEHWRTGLPEDAALRLELLTAIYHHDDGWAEWERSPAIDPNRGRPLDFMEMPIDDSLAIWRDSIRFAARQGALCGYLVSSHFVALLRRNTESHGGDIGWNALADEFFTEQGRCQAQWLEDWQPGQPASQRQELAQQAVRDLQFFDALSLWFCCAERETSQTFKPPASPQTVITPRAGTEFLFEPGTLDVNELAVSIRGQRVPAVRYVDSEALADELGRWVTLDWTLRS